MRINKWPISINPCSMVLYYFARTIIFLVKTELKSVDRNIIIVYIYLVYSTLQKFWTQWVLSSGSLWFPGRRWRAQLPSPVSGISRTPRRKWRDTAASDSSLVVWSRSSCPLPRLALCPTLCWTRVHRLNLRLVLYHHLQERTTIHFATLRCYFVTRQHLDTCTKLVLYL